MRAAIFIDGGYFLQQLKTARIAADYARLPDYLLASIRQAVPVDLLRCYFYYCAPWMPPTPSEEATRRMEAHTQFVQELESLNRWQVRLGKLERRWDGQKEYFEQKRVDVLLSVDLVRHAAAGHIQHAILIAGDSDFIPAIHTAKEAGVVVSLFCGTPNTVHKDLVSLVDEVQELNWRTFPQKKVEMHQDKMTEPVTAKDAATAPSKQNRTPRRRSRAKGLPKN